MSEVIAYALEKTSKGVNKIKIGRSENDLKDSNSKINKMCVSKKTPDDKMLKSCIFHSCCSSREKGIETIYDWCLEGIKDYALCTDDYQVYDLCYLEDIKREKERQKYIEMIKDKTNKYDHNMSVTYRMHEEFMVNIEKRRQMISRKDELEKICGEPDKVENSPEYMTLYQILQKAQEGYEYTQKNIEKVYNLKLHEVSKEEFIAQHTKTDKENVEKAKANLIHWINKNKRKPLSREQEQILSLDVQIRYLNKIISTTFENPVVYIYKAIKALEELEKYYKKDWRQEEFYNKIYNDLDVCRKIYKTYEEFMKDKNIEDIINKVEKEQKDAVEEERKIKQAQYIQTAKTGSRGFVVKLDGSVVQDTSTEPRLIIGKVITGKIEDEQWRNIRR